MLTNLTLVSNSKSGWLRSHYGYYLLWYPITSTAAHGLVADSNNYSIISETRLVASLEMSSLAKLLLTTMAYVQC